MGSKTGCTYHRSLAARAVELIDSRRMLRGALLLDAVVLRLLLPAGCGSTGACAARVPQVGQERARAQAAVRIRFGANKYCGVVIWQELTTLCFGAAALYGTVFIISTTIYYLENRKQHPHELRYQLEATAPGERVPLLDK